MCLIIIKKLLNNIIAMNDSMSILLATTILGLGGLGLYMYRTRHDEEDNNDNQDTHDKEEKCDEEGIFGLSNLLNWGDSVDKDKNENENEVIGQDHLLESEPEETHIKSRKKNTTKTQRNKKSTGSSRRRYY
jgi:hypothetical protein